MSEELERLKEENEKLKKEILRIYTDVLGASYDEAFTAFVKKMREE